MRAILTLILIAAVVVVILVLTNVINIRQTQDAALPAVAVQQGQMPEFDVDTADVEVGTERRQVEVNVPSVRVNGADNQAAGDTANAAPEPAETR